MINKSAMLKITKPAKKNSKQQRRSFSSPAISRMFQILQKCTLARAIFLEKEKIAGASKQ